MNEIETLAKKFSALLRAEIGSAIEEVNAMNAAETDKKICHSHDYCDANMIMFEAFETVHGREPNLNNDLDRFVWNKAWSTAAANKFYILKGAGAVNRYGHAFGFHTPERTGEFCALLKGENIPFQDESWHNDATDRISLTNTGLCVWVGDPDADGYEQTELMTDDDDARTIAAGTFAEIITAIKNYSHV